MTVHVNKDSVYTLSRYYHKSKSFPELRQLTVRIISILKKIQIKHCCVVYFSDSEMKEEEEVSVLPHGNALKRIRPHLGMSG